MAMIGAVSQEELKSFDELYRRFAGAAGSGVPEEPGGLSAIDLSIVDIVSSRPGITVGEIALVVCAPNSTLTSALDRLEKKGFAQRTANPLDRRSFGVRLTDSGTRLQQAVMSAKQTAFERILERLDTHEEREMLFYLLGKMTDPDRNAAQ